MPEASDPEVTAIQTIVGALTPLDAEARGRVISYVFDRLGLRASVSSASPPLPVSAPASVAAATTSERHHSTSSDIRALKDEKDPRSAIEMTALTAYYLSELSPLEERRDTITTDDLKKYFNQARFPLPKNPTMTLVHTKNAGYLESLGGGKYRLNPVGYNLVAYNLPSTTDRPSAPQRSTRSRTKR